MRGCRITGAAVPRQFSPQERLQATRPCSGSHVPRASATPDCKCPMPLGSGIGMRYGQHAANMQARRADFPHGAQSSLERTGTRWRLGSVIRYGVRGHGWWLQSGSAVDRPSIGMGGLGQHCMADRIFRDDFELSNESTVPAGSRRLWVFRHPRPRTYKRGESTRNGFPAAGLLDSACSHDGNQPVTPPDAIASRHA